MSEWRDVKDAPVHKDVIILLEKGVKSARYSPEKQYPWVCYDCEVLPEKIVLGWMPLPPPPKKKHSCGCNPLWVERVGDELVIYYYDHRGNRMNQIINACPFCGEAADE